MERLGSSSIDYVCLPRRYDSIETVIDSAHHLADLKADETTNDQFSSKQLMNVKVPEIVKLPTSYMRAITSQTKEFTPVDHILASYDMRNLSKFYAPPGSAEKAAYALLSLEKGSPITILTGFCVTAKLVDSKKTPVAETDGPPGAVLAGETLRKLSYSVSYVADPITCNVLRACLKSIQVADNCVHEFIARHDEKEQVEEAHRLINELKPKAMITGELSSRSWHDGIRRNMRGANINDWNPPVDEMLVQFKGKGIIIAIGDGGNEAGMANLKDNIPLALDGKTIMASGVYSDIPVTSWNSNLGFQAVASIAAAVEGKFELIPTADQVVKTIEAALDAGAVEGITLGKQENSLNGTYATRGVDGFAPSVHAADQDKLKSTLIQMKTKAML
ncbi:unnamed protein product [Rotaria sp. Silwood1]|nr:unnamed protein product [Rotaria sp. Silwood1]CAF1136956.1 unnamed protein product [Rotaria sp. Silwood1]CAF3464702.1 unnamed protein product [Rotaria sp. Silwood1]CAF3473888.1 unnamed protein product [Rotaria sp. Silwood1]CAF4798488.1 unnamed protein product [Rotaria sp. Silwood1]